MFAKFTRFLNSAKTVLAIALAVVTAVIGAISSVPSAA